MLLNGRKSVSRLSWPWFLSLLWFLHSTPLSALDSQVNVGQASAAANPAALFRQGKEAMQAGQLAAAEEDFRKVIALDPKSGAAHINLGVVYMRDRRWDEALAELHKAEVLSPQEPGIQLNIGLAYYRKNDFSSAIASFTEAMHAMPDSVQPRYLLGLCYFFTNRYKEASDTLAPLWEKESNNLNYLYVLSIAASKSSNAELQQRAFGQMLTIGRDTPEFHIYVGKAYLAEDDTSKALKEFQAAAVARPDLPLVHYFLGRTYLEQHAYSEAKIELERDITVEPNFAYSYEDLGILYAQLNQPDKAERYFRQAIERNSTLVNSYFGLAKLYRETGRYKDALEMIDHAIAIVPQSASLHFTKGQVLTRLGQPVEARKEFDLTASLHKSFNDRLQQDQSGDKSADAEFAAQE
jgi:tetratricopeptide (TPR) repeat protein